MNECRAARLRNTRFRPVDYWRVMHDFAAEGGSGADSASRLGGLYDDATHPTRNASLRLARELLAAVRIRK